MATRKAHRGPAVGAPLRPWRYALLAGAICTAATPARAATDPPAPPGQAATPPGNAPPGAPPAPAPTPFAWRQLRAAGQHLGDRDLLLQTGAMAAAAALITLRDDAWTSWIVEERPFGGDAYDIGYEIGHRRQQAALVVAITAAGLVSDRTRIRDTGLLLGQAQLLGAGLAQVFKSATDRPRPGGGDRNSLPSGHAVSAWTMAAVLQRRHGWWIGGPAYAAAVYTGASRIQGNRHHPSDVLAGFALAHWISAAVCRSVEPGAKTRGNVRWLPPELGPGGALVLVAARF